MAKLQVMVYRNRPFLFNPTVFSLYTVTYTLGFGVLSQFSYSVCQENNFVGGQMVADIYIFFIISVLHVLYF